MLAFSLTRMESFSKSEEVDPVIVSLFREVGERDKTERDSLY